eukprot:TRINITY_DN32556_c0_g1_i1.p1 TRINITY_DN32556_c0_g1~~TRINITY_DN32556_c0_g1_i1.p1  ORF type:complete len:348 (+),score=61.53 TRINITY_DN32556_c0_g1_i1:93-1136(+)
MSSARLTTAALTRTQGGLPSQYRPTNPKHSHEFRGPGYNASTRDPAAGIATVASHNERPYMDWKDTWRSSAGYFTREDSGQAAWVRYRNRLLATRTEPGWGFFGAVPGRAQANPAAAPGSRVLSSRWQPYELADDGVLFIHPTQREILEWTQEQLHEDAKANGRDVDGEHNQKIDELLQHDPVQPYFHRRHQRLWLVTSIRRDIIRQEMRVHSLRREKGLSTPPIILKYYDEEYPSDPSGEPKTRVRFKWWHTDSWQSAPRFGHNRVGLPVDMQARARKRQQRYAEELAKQGMEVPFYRDPAPDADPRMPRERSWDLARERAMRMHGGAAAEATVVDAESEEEPFVG